MFKLLALRILDGCADHIKKCLHEDIYYYFCTDFRFEINDRVYRGSRYTEPMHENFFAPIPKQHFLEQDKNSPKININAIVGKNGDGKSTIIELMIRMINNYMMRHLESQRTIGVQKLIYVHGVAAEIYFQIDDAIYCMCSKTNNSDKQSVPSNIDIKQIANVSTFRQNSEIQYVNRFVKRASSKVLESIYTLVSNYSHYAYNMFDFRDEWIKESNDLNNEETQNEIFWMHRIFHKNDGYITPLSIHPYRISGNIDVNKEAELSKQRLLYLFVKSSDEPYSFRNILGKKAVAIRMTPSKTDKLLDRSIIEFFLAKSDEDNSLDWVLEPVKNTYSDLCAKLRKKEKPPIIDFMPQIKILNDTYFGEAQDVLDHILLGSGFAERERLHYHDFLEFATKKVGAKGKVKQSSIARFFNAILKIRKKINDTYGNNSNSNFIYQMLPDASFLEKYRVYEKYNLQQMARLYTIFTIALRYRIDTTILSSPFKKLSNKEKAQLYKIYKTLSIFETYPRYKAIIQKGKQKWGEDATYEYDKDTLNLLFEQLEEDKAQGSHITRKLEQTDNYLRNNKDLYLDGKDAEITYSYPDSKIKDISFLADYYGTDVVDIFHLIPPVFEYDVVLRNGESFLELGKLSSGEKQLLNNIGAVIYHLQNIDAATVTYESVNLLLEEIELYFHPEYQRQFINRLVEQIYGLDLKNIKNINISFVTHSPFILSDVPKCNVLFLKDGKPDYSMQENTFGANIHSLLKNGFFLPNLPMGEFAHQKINELFRQLNSGDYDHSEVNAKRIKEEIALIGEPYLREQLYRLLREQQ